MIEKTVVVTYRVEDADVDVDWIVELVDRPLMLSKNIRLAQVVSVSPVEAGSPIPAKGTPGFELYVSALDVATVAPFKKGSTSFSAQIPWSIIDRLREAFVSLGIDWRSVKEKTS